MKGKVLGVGSGAEPGVIVGEDGNRYRYSATDWKGAREAAVGAQVDFDVQDGQARDVYPALSDNVLGGLSAPKLEGLTASPVVGKVKQLATGTLAFPLAVIVIIAFFLPALSTPEETVNQFGLGKPAKEITLQLAETNFDEAVQSADERIEQHRQMMEQNRRNAGPFGPMFSEQDLKEGLQSREEDKAEIIQARSKANALKAVISVFMARFAALGAAVWLLWLTWAGRAVALPSLVAGVLTIGAASLPFLFKSAVVAAVEADAIIFLTVSAAQVEAGISIGIGVWILLAAGAGLIASSLGLVRNPLAAR